MENIAIVCPSYNDYDCVASLAQELRTLSLKTGCASFDLIVVNDSPWIQIPDNLYDLAREKEICSIHVLQLKVNLGHQAALAIGLAWLMPRLHQYNYVVTMDADGEDNPWDIVSMIRQLETCQDRQLACVAKRGLRKEKFQFRIGYELYKALTFLLLGSSIDFGNYICFRPAAVQILVKMSETSTHIAASTLRSRMPIGSVTADRRNRYSGESRMGGYSSLVLHAFRAYSVFGDKIAVRLIIYVVLSLLASLLGIVIVGLIRFTHIIDVMPGWASIASLLMLGVAAITSINLFGFSLLLIASQRSTIGITPQTLLHQYLQEELVI
jgi:glycosyltransferase involved in cell wall biosynthesis